MKQGLESVECLLHHVVYGARLETSVYGLESMECLLHHVVYGARLETSVYGLTLEIYEGRGYRRLEARLALCSPIFLWFLL
ncbi:unnamed protein product [Trifolium pratense]|uniref:Uncharacterized protein n=1 Tax=Trifolium pratense TaxID=57577 RepID=A0ACB0JF88_TRIPR|nr:unnamed protein product [Trifolium pratense]